MACQVLVLVDSKAENVTARDRSGSTSSRTEALLPIGIEGAPRFFCIPAIQVKLVRPYTLYLTSDLVKPKGFL